MKIITTTTPLIEFFPRINSDLLINVDYKEVLLKLTREITIEKVLFLIRRMEFLLRDIQRNLNSRVLILEFIKSFTTAIEEESV